MQRTTDLVTDNEPLSEWTAVVGARCANREELAAMPRNDHIVFADFPLDYPSIRNSVNRNAGSEIR